MFSSSIIFFEHDLAKQFMFWLSIILFKHDFAKLGRLYKLFEYFMY